MRFESDHLPFRVNFSFSQFGVHFLITIISPSISQPPSQRPLFQRWRYSYWLICILIWLSLSLVYSLVYFLCVDSFLVAFSHLITRCGQVIQSLLSLKLICQSTSFNTSKYQNLVQKIGQSKKQILSVKQ